MKREVDSVEIERQPPTGFLLALAIGALVGIGLAVTWLPERRRSHLRGGIASGYRRVRESGAAALDEMRERSLPALRDFREELAANVEAAREEFRDMARRQVKQARKSLQREYKRLGR